MITKITEEVIDERIEPHRKVITVKNNGNFVEKNKKYLKDSKKRSDAERTLRKYKTDIYMIYIQDP